MATDAPITGAPMRAPSNHDTIDHDALEALNRRLDHTAAIARMVANWSGFTPDEGNAVHGIAETLTELAERMDRVLNLTTAAGAR